jgi:Fibronectin type III domain
MANKDFKVKNGIDIQTPLPVSMGGTGQTSTTNTLNSLLPAQAGNANKVLQTDGTNTTWYTLPSAYTRGGTAARPGSPTAGDLHFNTDKKAFEVWTGDAWVSVAVNGAVPLAPTIGTVTVSGLTASVPFTGPTDFGDAAISTYTATSNPGAITASNATSPISVSGLTANTSYTFTVTATNSYGTSNASSASNSITTANVPGAPTSVTVTDPGTDGYATVSWTAPASNGGSAITDYIVQYSSNSGSTWTTFSDGTSTSTSAIVTGLTLDTAYIFRVAAVNVIGTGSYSTASSSFTPVAHDSGVLYPLQVITVGAAGASSVTFTNIPSTYKHLQIRALYFCTNTNNPYFRVGGSSIDTAGNYSWHHLYGDGSSILNNGAGSQSFTYFGYSQNATYGNTAVIDVLDYASANKNKTFRILAGQDNNGGGEVALWSGAWYNSSTAIQRISFIPGSGTFSQYSQFALYGVKSA